MRYRSWLATVAGVGLPLITGYATARSAADPPQWPDFRGPHRDGHADKAKPPVDWSDPKHLAWTTAIQGSGHSSPIVCGRTVWVTTALDDGKSMHAVCLDLDTGSVRHDVEVFKTANPGPKHDFNSFASPSAVSDGDHVYLWFGTHGLACLDAESARPLWTKTDFNLDFMTGAGSSPVLFGDLLILECDAVNAQYVQALDKKTGQQVWKTARSVAYEDNAPQKKRAFSTAVVEKIDGLDVLLSVGSQRAYGYNVADGQELFYVDHPGYSNVARPLLAERLMVFSTCYNRAELWAVRLPEKVIPGGPSQNLSKRIAWKSTQGIPNKPSPVLVDGTIYFVSDTGVARALDAQTGHSIWSGRLGQKYSASPLFAGGSIYFLSESGEVHVVRPGTPPEVTDTFKVAEGFMGSPAVVGNSLVLRSSGHVYRAE